jgi:hypothetical protein
MLFEAIAHNHFAGYERSSFETAVTEAPFEVINCSIALRRATNQ